jgi:hypothetical protein
MFHVSLLQKADVDPTQVLPQIPVEVIQDLKFEVKLIKILDWEEELQNKRIPIL